MGEKCPRCEALETALRTQIWNACKAANMTDDGAMKVVRDRLRQVDLKLETTHAE